MANGIRRATRRLEPALFSAAEAIITERRTDISKRASASSDYLLTGLVVCGQCGQHFTGNAAHGRSARYRYYTCRSRHRYGASSTCSSQRLPADVLDAAVLDALLSAYEQNDRFDRALDDSARHIAASRARFEAEIRAITTVMADTEERIKRYLLAFESGHLPEAACGGRIRELTIRIAELTNRRANLLAELEGEPLRAPTAVELSDLRLRVRKTIEQGSTCLQKAIVQALVHEVRVESRTLVVPFFKLPNPNQGTRPVRAPAGVVGRPGLEPGTLGLRVPCSAN